VIPVAAPWWLAARGAPLGDRVRGWLSLPRAVARIRSGQYDVGVDLRGDLRQIFLFLALGRCRERVSSDRTGGARLLTRCARYVASGHEVERGAAIAALLGVKGPPVLEPPELPELDAAASDAIAAVAGANGYITLSTQGTKRNRTWPATHAASLVERAAAELGLGTVYVGGPEDGAAAEETARLARVPMAQLAGKLPLLQSLKVIEGARAAVAVDSGPMHLAALVDTPVVALFGPSDPARYRPWASRYEIVCARAPCGCVDPDCEFTASGPGACMMELQPGVVFNALQRLVGACVPVR
ncbi:MAG TPA: glycosyltransferase family 9 protein, partial [Opitutaceae bacterium]|nr:glycosyltransferase family 9 protein [Opitutaceae bacterium]